MRYELLLQPADAQAPYDAAPVEALLDARGATAQPDGSLRWPLKAGDVEVRRVLENGHVIATELKVPLSEKTELVRELVTEGARLATEAGLRLVDPALAKALTAKDEAAVADQFLRAARYAGQYLGVSSAVMASYGAAEPSGLKAGTRVLLGLAAFFAALYVLAQWLL